jgi:hypothetical protein
MLPASPSSRSLSFPLLLNTIVEDPGTDYIRGRMGMRIDSDEVGDEEKEKDRAGN